MGRCLVRCRVGMAAFEFEPCSDCTGSRLTRPLAGSRRTDSEDIRGVRASSSRFIQVARAS